MEVYIKSLYNAPDEFSQKSVKAFGWVRTARSSKDLGFIELNDGSCFKNLQIVFERTGIDNFDEIARILPGTAIMAEGFIIMTPDAHQPFEMKSSKIIIEGHCPSEYPLQKKRHSFEFLRTIAHLRPRTNTFSAVFRVRSEAAFAIHEFFHKRGFVYVNTPIITGSDCEGAGEMFRVTVDGKNDFFGKETNLTVSGQLSAESYSMAFRNVYTFGPAFRAEKSNTTRHAAEFWMIEPEMAFADLEKDMETAEGLLKYLIQYIIKNNPDEMDFFNKHVDTELLNRLNNILNSKFESISYTNAVDIIKKSGRDFDYPLEWGKDLQTEHERFLTENYFKKPLFVIDYPKDIKAFYMRQNNDGRTVAAMDLLVPGVGEIIGGSQREERLDYLLHRMKELGLRVEDYNWYTDLRSFGGVKHSGFGLGFERALMYITGMQNIRDVIPFPRTYGYAEF